MLGIQSHHKHYCIPSTNEDWQTGPRHTAADKQLLIILNKLLCESISLYRLIINYDITSLIRSYFQWLRLWGVGEEYLQYFCKARYNLMGALAIGAPFLNYSIQGDVIAA